MTPLPANVPVLLERTFLLSGPAGVLVDAAELLPSVELSITIGNTSVSLHLGLQGCTPNATSSCPASSVVASPIVRQSARVVSPPPPRPPLASMELPSVAESLYQAELGNLSLWTVSSAGPMVSSAPLNITPSTLFLSVSPYSYISSSPSNPLHTETGEFALFVSLSAPNPSSLTHPYTVISFSC